MARFLIGTMPVTGHVGPGLPIARELVERGHEVWWYTGKRFKEAHDATKRLKAFDKQVQAVEEVIDTEQITRRLLEEASLVFDAPSGAVYLKRDGDLRLLHATEEWDGDANLIMPLASNGEPGFPPGVGRAPIGRST